MDGDRPSIEGIWTGMIEGHYVLKKAHLLVHADAEPTPVGETYVPRDKVMFMQRVTR